MPADPDKLIQFWQELKRRKVIRVVAMYAATAFIIMEAVDIMLPRLGLPDWTVTFIIVLLIVGFPITIILSWIFDITPGGVKKTEPAEESMEQESAPEPVKSRLKASNVIIIGLLAVVAVLLYPKIFKSDHLRILRDDQGMISVAVLPFDNLTGDSSLYFWQNGISEYLINGLGSSDELAVSSSQVISDVLEGTRQVYTASLSPDIARRTASKINASIYITGNYIGTGKDVSILLNLVNTENGDLIWSTRVDGDLDNNFRNTLGRLSDTVRNYLEIKSLEEQVDKDLSNAYPNSAEAYRHYINGLNAIVEGNYYSAIESLLTAYEIDTTFTFAAFYLAFAHNFSGQADLWEGQYRWIKRAYELRKNLPPSYQPWIELWHACSITEDVNDIRRYCNLLSEAALHSRFLLFDLGVTYSDWLGEYKKSIEAFEKVEKLNMDWDDDWKYERYYNTYCWTLLEAGRPEKVEGIAERGLLINPENGWLILYLGSSYIMQGDTLAAEKCIVQLEAIFDKYNATDSDKERYIGLMYLHANDSLMAEKHYRKAYGLDPENINRIVILARLLIESGSNIEEGLSLAEKGLRISPDDLAMLRWKGLALHKLGKHEEALEIFNNIKEKIMRYDWQLDDYIHDAKQALAIQSN